MSSTDTVIIGAGPYGLSVSTYLSAAGIPHEILGDPMHAWINFMPPGMLMRSEAFASNLYAPQPGYTIEAFCRQRHIDYAPVGMRLSLETFVEYALWFQSHLVSQVRTVDVTEMRRHDGGFRLNLSDGSTLLARRAIIALGLKGFEKTPPLLQDLPRPYVIHSGEIGNLTWAAGKDIALVGGGQSALGLAALFKEIGSRVNILVRDGTVTWTAHADPSRGMISRMITPYGGLGPGWRSHILSEWPFTFHMLSLQRRKRMIATSWGPSGAWWLRDRVSDGDILLNTEIRHIEVKDGRVVLQIATGGKSSRITTDHVVVATGFKVDLSRHAFLSREIVDSLSTVDGAPELTHNFETNIPDLYVIGPAAALSFGPAMRFIYGAKYAAPCLTRHISARLKKDVKGHAGQPINGRPEFVEVNGGNALPDQPAFRNPKK